MFGKPSCTHGIFVSLLLLRYIQCGFSISHQSFPGIVAHHRCNISHIFTFSFQFQCAMSCCALHLSNIFSEGVKTGWHGMKVGGQGCGVIIICFKILACLISVNVFGLLFSLFMIEFYYHYYQYSHYHYYHHYYYGYFFYRH